MEIGAFDFTLIDHGHCFTGPTWRSEQLASSASGQYCCPPHPFLREGARTFPHSLDDTSTAIEGCFGPELLKNICAAVPSAWQLEGAAAEAIVSFLEERAKRARSDGKALLL
ncbi:MAG: hypothetical protein ACRD2E_03705 [Terriglobales bacterium]